MLYHQLPRYSEYLFGALALVAAAFDFKTRKIPNLLTLPALAAGLGLAGFCGLAVFRGAALGMAVAVAVFVPLFFAGVFGAGDGKLVMALSTVLGARGAFELVLWSIIAGGLAAIVILARRHRLKAVVREIFKFFKSIFIPGLVADWPKLDKSNKAPFGIAIFVGYVITCVQG